MYFLYYDRGDINNHYILYNLFFLSFVLKFLLSINLSSSITFTNMFFLLYKKIGSIWKWRIFKIHVLAFVLVISHFGLLPKIHHRYNKHRLYLTIYIIVIVRVWKIKKIYFERSININWLNRVLLSLHQFALIINSRTYY